MNLTNLDVAHSVLAVWFAAVCYITYVMIKHQGGWRAKDTGSEQRHDADQASDHGDSCPRCGYEGYQRNVLRFDIVREENTNPKTRNSRPVRSTVLASDHSPERVSAEEVDGRPYCEERIFPGLGKVPVLWNGAITEQCDDGSLRPQGTRRAECLGECCTGVSRLQQPEERPNAWTEVEGWTGTLPAELLGVGKNKT